MKYRWFSIKTSHIQDHSRDSDYMLKISFKLLDWNNKEVYSPSLPFSEEMRLHSLLKKFYSGFIHAIFALEKSSKKRAKLWDVSLLSIEDPLFEKNYMR